VTTIFLHPVRSLVINSVAILTDNDHFHCFKPDYDDQSIAKGLQSGLITHEDVGLILSFIAEPWRLPIRWFCFGSSSNHFRRIRFPVSTGEIENLSNSPHTGVNPSLKTPVTILFTCANIFVWLVLKGQMDILEKKLRAIRYPKKTTKTAPVLISIDEIETYLSVCKSPRLDYDYHPLWRRVSCRGDRRTPLGSPSI
jgi:hypothetical protein